MGGQEIRVDVVALGDAVRAEQQRWRERLVQLSRSLHAEPELAFAEHRSVEKVTELLGAAGFAVEPGPDDVPTAFTAVRGSGEFTVGICAEYDALPEIGHACGHNIIASAAVGAAIGLAAAADDLGIRVKVIGTPAEEHGGGKVLLLERGVFDDVTVAMMVHPGQADVHPAAFASQAVTRFAVTYAGRASHAAAAPHQGINAADAAVVAQVAIGLLRQQTTGDCRIGLFVREGGAVTNIIPEKAVVDCEVRAFDVETMSALQERVMACFDAGARASGATMTVELTEPLYADLVQEPAMSDRFAAHVEALGRSLRETHGMRGGSTDMGNVSHVVPSIHPSIAIIGCEHPPHTRGFAAAAATPAGDDAAVDGAAAMALTAVDVAADPVLRQKFLDEHAARRTSAAT
ncbi:amidohydrolase [Saccharopolyspora antimicrobica]|uniref:Peptidase M20 domain-containing protein 2 n=1 Tax=Saccharopolyspora antimicrobica TaxID=455193 RepID=A0A1I4TYF4_9PSEU|nr:amidohydrolase [Saccharopolyspora antimicrobica]RKT88594.1 amidohydrolase [Saccharopolyspora antimicrobica]SFM81774.1 amidohydrolase [Saccharopolyspora antimicrobica]